MYAQLQTWAETLKTMYLSILSTYVYVLVLVHSEIILKCLCLITALVTSAYQGLFKLYNDRSSPERCQLTDKRLEQLMI